MTETTTPTDEVVDQSSSGTGDGAPLLEQDNEQDSAVEQNSDTDANESDASDSDDSSSQGDESEDDKGLAKFAKSQGFDDYDNLSDDAKKALRIARKQVQRDRKDLEDKANQRKLGDEMNELTKPSKDDNANDVLLKRMARFEARDMTTTFWSEHQDDKKYEPKMAEILAKEKEEYGPDAAWRLAQNLPRLLREAKFAAGAYDSDAARETGRREERERLRKAQEGSADNAHATQGSSVSSKRITRESLDAMPREEYEKIRDSGELDRAIARGDLY